MFRAAREKGEEKWIELMMPRFKTTYDASLEQPFKKLGMRIAFNENQADFSGMTGRPPSDPRHSLFEYDSVTLPGRNMLCLAPPFGRHQCDIRL